MNTASNGSAPSTSRTAMVAGPVVGTTVFINLNTRVTEARFEETVLKLLRTTPIDTLENILEWRRREDWI